MFVSGGLATQGNPYKILYGSHHNWHMSIFVQRSFINYNQVWYRGCQAVKRQSVKGGLDANNSDIDKGEGDMVRQGETIHQYKHHGGDHST